MATVDWGTATSPIYFAKEKGIDVHVYVDETRPRNQGAQLTTWELFHNDISHNLIVDNAGGHLMQHKEIDLVIVGSDRTSSTGDVCNKIGTYLKALAAFDNNIPFYVALPSSTIDWNIKDGIKEIPIEERDPKEVNFVQGKDKNNNIISVDIAPRGTKSRNPAFDVTPSRLVSGLITEHGICDANYNSIKKIKNFSIKIKMFSNKWNEKDQKIFVNFLGNTDFDFDLGSRVYTSRLIGSIPDLVMHGGGNTSCKSIKKDTFGKDINVISVKGSGWDLGTIEAEGLPSIKLEPLLKLRTLDKLTDEEMVNQQRSNLLKSNSPNPSVETLLHAFLPHKFIDHTHATPFLILANFSKL